MHIWVVELFNRVSGRWEPCAEARLTKTAAQKAVKNWKANNPTDNFRVRKYTPWLK